MGEFIRKNKVACIIIGFVICACFGYFAFNVLMMHVENQHMKDEAYDSIMTNLKEQGN